MGKLIPPQTHKPGSEVRDPSTSTNSQPGPLQLQARTLSDHLRQVEEAFDLDELDRLARRHARLPASGSAEALDALALVVRGVPDAFIRTEVNFYPERLEVLADRQRGLDVLDSAITRFADLVKDSVMEEGDELVELLIVGCARARLVEPERLAADERLAQAMAILASYQQRVIDESAHKSAADTDDEARKSSKKR